MGCESLSSRRAWIEIATRCRGNRRSRSLSSRRAGIEMGRVSRRAASTSSRSPHGERGLKFSGCGDFAWRMLSLSSRRAWIEIFPVLFSDPSVRSLSSRRAWIEISWHVVTALWCLSLSSRRAWIEILAGGAVAGAHLVALLTESVD